MYDKNVRVSHYVYIKPVARDWSYFPCDRWRTQRFPPVRGKLAIKIMMTEKRGSVSERRTSEQRQSLQKHSRKNRLRAIKNASRHIRYLDAFSRNPP